MCCIYVIWRHLPPTYKYFTIVIKSEILHEQGDQLYLGTLFSNSIDSLPQSITHLSFGSCFNKSVNNLPPNITHLTFGSHFNQPVNHLPNKIQHLSFGCNFNQNISQLPPHCTHITFGVYFDHKVDHLPSTVKYLRFIRSCFNHPIDNLPPFLTHLVLENSTKFNQRIDHLPSTVTHLILQSTAYSLPLQLPPGLQSFSYEYSIVNSWCTIPPLSPILSTLRVKHLLEHSFVAPPSLTSLEAGSLPANFCELCDLTELVTLWFKNSNIFCIHSLPTLPSRNLSALTIVQTFRLPENFVAYLPATLQFLKLATPFNEPIDYLPTSLQHLEIIVQDWGGNYAFNQPIDYLPPNLRKLKIASPTFNQATDNLPASLTSLCLDCGVFNSPVDNLPSSLTFLSISSSTYEGHLDHLPSSLTSLQLNASWTGCFLDHLPLSLRYLQVSNFFKAISPLFYHLPPKLAYLQIVGNASLPIDHLPTYLKYLEISSFSDTYQSSSLPKYLVGLVPSTIAYVDYYFEAPERQSIAQYLCF